jgi:rhomboid protease GluP
MTHISPVGLPTKSVESLTDLMQSSPARAPLTHALLVINVLVFLAMLSQGASLWHTTTGIQLAWGANFGPATQDGQWWRLATAMFVHFGMLHLGMNMWALRDVGRLVERLYGPWRFVFLYLGSGVLGNLLSLVVQGNRAVSGGASGAIFGQYGALLVFLWRERRQVDAHEFRWLFWAATVFVALIFAMGIWVVPGIDNSAHAGGFLAGALLARSLARPWTSSSPSAGRGRWLAVVALLVGTGWLTGHIPPPSYVFHEEITARDAIQRFTLADQHFRQQWAEILNTPFAGGSSFEALAGRVESTVAVGYEKSFDQLVAATPGSSVPSAAALGEMQAYALEQAQTSRELVAGLRARDPQKIRDALHQAQSHAASASRSQSIIGPASAASAGQKR